MLLNVRLHDHDLSFHTLLNHEDHLETWLNGFNKIHVMVSNTVLDHYLTISFSYVEIISNNLRHDILYRYALQNTFKDIHENLIIFFITSK